MFANRSFFCGSGKSLQRYLALTMSNTCAMGSFSVSTYPGSSSASSFLIHSSFFVVYAHRLIETLAPPASSRPLTAGENKRVKRENIQHFLDSARTYGMAETELFEVEDLLSMQDIPKVTRCLYALGKHVSHCNPFSVVVLIRFRSFCVGSGKVWQTWTGHSIRWVAQQWTEWAHREPRSAQWNAYWRWSLCVTCQHQLAKRSTGEKQSNGRSSYSPSPARADIAANAIKATFRVEGNAGAEWREGTCQNRSSSDGQPHLVRWQAMSNLGSSFQLGSDL